MHDWAIPAGVVLLLLLLTAIASKLGRRTKLPYYSRKHLLSNGEAAFFHCLQRAVPARTMLAPKVRVADILACDAAAWKKGFGARISQKHVDFLLIDEKTTEFILVIELDDKSHFRQDRRDRDLFLDKAFECAGLRVLHVPAAAKYNVADLSGKVLALLNA